MNINSQTLPLRAFTATPCTGVSFQSISTPLYTIPNSPIVRISYYFNRNVVNFRELAT